MPVCHSVSSFYESIYCVDPYSWAYLGAVLSIVLSVAGAIIGIFLSGASILGSAIKAPRVKSKNLVSVIFCEAVAIYGVVCAVLMVMKIKGFEGDFLQDEKIYSRILFSSQLIFWLGIVVGGCNLICGVCVGVAGQSCVLSDTQNPQTFVKLLIVEIFASAIGLFGLIIAVVGLQKVDFPLKIGL